MRDAGGGHETQRHDSIDPAFLQAARAVAEGRAPLPRAGGGLAFAKDLEERAAHEGAGVRAAELQATAAGVYERLWRSAGQRQASEPALRLYDAALRVRPWQGACLAGLRAAFLAGDVAHDASVTYAALYRAARLVAGTARDAGATDACSDEVTHALARLAAFRPTGRVLDAVDEALQADGMVVSSPNETPAASRAPPKIMRIDSFPGPDSARVVVELDQASGYRVGDEAIAGKSLPRTPAPAARPPTPWKLPLCFGKRVPPTPGEKSRLQSTP